MGSDGKPQDAVGAEVGGEDILPIRREHGAMDVRRELSRFVRTGGFTVEKRVCRCRCAVCTKRKDRQASSAIVGGQYHLLIGNDVARLGAACPLFVQQAQASVCGIEGHRMEGGCMVVHLADGVNTSPVLGYREERRVRQGE